MLSSSTDIAARGIDHDHSIFSRSSYIDVIYTNTSTSNDTQRFSLSKKLGGHFCLRADDQTIVCMYDICEIGRGQPKLLINGTCVSQICKAFLRNLLWYENGWFG